MARFMRTYGSLETAGGPHSTNLDLTVKHFEPREAVQASRSAAVEPPCWWRTSQGTFPALSRGDFDRPPRARSQSDLRYLGGRPRSEQVIRSEMSAAGVSSTGFRKGHQMGTAWPLIQF